MRQRLAVHTHVHNGFGARPQAGVVEWVIECLTDLAKSPLVCRQACIVLRNMVVRTPELRPAYLEKGACAPSRCSGW